MTDTLPDTPAPDKAPSKPKPDRTDPQTTGRGVLFGAASILAVLVGAGVFAAGGWIALAAAGAATVVGGAGVARVARPARRSRAGRTRRARISTVRSPRTGGGSLSWPFTGNQSRRARTGFGNRRAASPSPLGSRSRTTRFPKLGVGSAGRSGRTASAGRGRGAGRSGTSNPGTRTARSTRPGTARRARLAAANARGATVPPRTRPAARAKATRTALTTAPRSRRPVPTRSPGRAPSRPLGRAGARPAMRSARRPLGARAGTRPTTRSRTGRSPRARVLGGTGARGKTPSLSGRTRARSTRPGSRITPRSGTRAGTRSPARRTPARPVGTIRRAASTRARRTSTAGGRKLGAPARRPVAGRARRRQTSGRPVPGATRVTSPLPANRTGGPLKQLTRKPVKPIVRTALGMRYPNGTRPNPLLRRTARRVLASRARHATVAGLRKGTKAAAYRTGRAIWPVIPQPFTVPPANVPTKLTAPSGPRYPIPRPLPVPETKGPQMSGSIDAVTEAFASMAAFSPANKDELEQFLSRLHEIQRDEATALKTLGDRLVSEYPMAAPIADEFMELASSVAALVDHADQILVTFRNAHVDELERIENPRPNEQFWDVGNNR